MTTAETLTIPANLTDRQLVALIDLLCDRFTTIDGGDCLHEGLATAAFEIARSEVDDYDTAEANADAIYPMALHSHADRLAHNARRDDVLRCAGVLPQRKLGDAA